MKLAKVFKALISLAIAVTGLSASAGAVIAECKIQKLNQEPKVVPVEAWEPASNEQGAHATELFETQNARYSIWIPFSNDLSKTNLSVGHAQDGGVAIDTHASADLNQSYLSIEDMKENISIKCEKKTAN